MQENEPFGNYKLLYMAETLSVCEVFIYSFNHQVVTKHIYMLNSVLGPENTSVNKVGKFVLNQSTVGAADKPDNCSNICMCNLLACKWRYLEAKNKAGWVGGDKLAANFEGPER